MNHDALIHKYTQLMQVMHDENTKMTNTGVNGPSGCKGKCKNSV